MPVPTCATALALPGTGTPKMPGPPAVANALAPTEIEPALVSETFATAVPYSTAAFAFWLMPMPTLALAAASLEP